MGMRQQLLQAARQAFAAFGDVIVSGEYVRKTGDGVRDVETGVTNYPETAYTINKLAMTGFSQKETDKDPTLLTLEKMLFLAEELPAGVKVDTDGTIRAPETPIPGADIETWEIVKKLKDPASILVILAVRIAQ